MPESLININGYSLRNLNRVNILLGKNGCGKSTLLRSIEGNVSTNAAYGSMAYITPERGGSLTDNPNIEQNVANNPRHIPDARRRNQANDFKQQSVVNYRALKELVQDEIETIAAIRNDHSVTFDSYIEKINVLLDNIKIVRDRTIRSFKIVGKADGNPPISPEQISSGESELIALGIECLTFFKKIDNAKSNILFLDEPDVHLHPDLQTRLVAFLNKLIAENQHFQVIIATHSTAIMGAYGEGELVSIAFMKSGARDITFQKVSKYHRDILPVFGAHPLSEVFNARPILLVEGEDDVRIWQQAVRTSHGKVKVYPVSTDTISAMNAYEVEVQSIIASVYDTAIAYSLRDRDEEPEVIDDLEKVIRFRLSCRNAENLILSDEVLQVLGTDWPNMQIRINEWIDAAVNQTRPDHATFVAFRDGGFKRKTFDFKEVRNVLIYLSRSRKPWEVAVGQAIGNLTWKDDTDFAVVGSLVNFLGEKVVRRLIPEV